MKIRKLKTDRWGDPIYSWEKGWDEPPLLRLFRPVCWVFGHQPQDFRLVDPATKRETPITWCGLCKYEFPQRVEIPSRVARATRVLPARNVAGLTQRKETKALNAAPLNLNTVRSVATQDRDPAMRQERLAAQAIIDAARDLPEFFEAGGRTHSFVPLLDALDNDESRPERRPS